MEYLKEPGQTVQGSDLLSSLLFPICISHGLGQIAHSTDIFCVLLLFF